MAFHAGQPCSTWNNQTNNTISPVGVFSKTAQSFADMTVSCQVGNKPPKMISNILKMASSSNMSQEPSPEQRTTS